MRMSEIGLAFRSLLAYVFGSRNGKPIDPKTMTERLEKAKLPKDLLLGKLTRGSGVRFVVRDPAYPTLPLCGWRGSDPQAAAAAFAQVAYVAGLPFVDKEFEICEVLRNKSGKRRLRARSIGRFTVKRGDDG